MTERGILFKPAMVKAILDGQKTQTRRIVIIPTWADEESGVEIDRAYLNDKEIDWPYAISRKTGCQSALDCPYGQPGDRLYVREPWILLPREEWDDPQRPNSWIHTRYGVPRANAAAYKADTTMDGEEIRKAYGYSWKPSIHMPKWASRLWLEITGVRVEQLQDISEEDAIAEGVTIKVDAEIAARVAGETPARMEFWDLWKSIHGSGSWELNPWVWIIEFQRIERVVA